MQVHIYTLTEASGWNPLCSAEPSGLELKRQMRGVRSSRASLITRLNPFPPAGSGFTFGQGLSSGSSAAGRGGNLAANG